MKEKTAYMGELRIASYRIFYAPFSAAKFFPKGLRAIFSLRQVDLAEPDFLFLRLRGHGSAHGVATSV
jgi:hypothetical protein